MENDFKKYIQGKPLSFETTLFLEKHLVKKKWETLYSLMNDDFKALYEKYKEDNLS